MFDWPNNVDHGNLVLEAVKTLGLLIGGGWVLWTFVVGRKFAPTIEFQVNARVLPYSETENLIECSLLLSNKGTTRHKVRNLTITVRGLKGGDEMKEWKGHGAQVAFPEIIVKKAPLFPEGWKFSFVEPGVTQTYVYVARSTTEISHLLLHGEFSYRADYPHTARKVIATAASASAESLPS